MKWKQDSTVDRSITKIMRSNFSPKLDCKSHFPINRQRNLTRSVKCKLQFDDFVPGKCSIHDRQPRKHGKRKMNGKHRKYVDDCGVWEKSFP